MITVPTGLEVLDDGPQSVIACTGRLLFALTLRPPTVQSVARFRDILAERAELHPEGLFVVVSPGARRPSLAPDVRDAIGDAWSASVPRLAGAVVWVRRRSFVGAVQRSLVTAIVIARRVTKTIKVVADIDDGLRFFANIDAGIERELPRWGEGMRGLVAAHADPQAADPTG